MPKFTATEEDVAEMVGATSNEGWWIIAVVQCVVDYCAALQLLTFSFIIIFTPSVYHLLSCNIFRKRFAYSKPCHNL